MEKRVEPQSSDPLVYKDTGQDIHWILTHLFNTMFPFVLSLGAIAIAASFYRTFIQNYWYPIFFFHMAIYMFAVAIYLFRRRLPMLLVFSILLAFVYAIALQSLITLGLVGTGIVHLVILCFFAGIFLGIKAGMIALAVSIFTVILTGTGVCAGFITTRPNITEYLASPANWVLQVSCFLMYVMPLIISTNGLKKRTIHFLQEMKASNLLLEKEVQIRREADEKSRSIFDNAVMGFFQSTADGVYLNANLAYAKMRGFNSAEELMKNVTDIEKQLYVDPGDREIFMEILNSEGIVTDFETQQYCRDGSIIWVSFNARAVRDENDKILHYEGTSQNITDRKHNDEALRKSETRLRQIIDLVPHFIFAKDRGGHFVLVNKAVADAYGTTVENLVGKTDADFNPNKNEVEHFLRDDLLVIDSGRPKEIPEERITDSKGNVRILQTTKIPFNLSMTGDDAIMGVSTDITGRKLAERALHESEERYRSIFDNAMEGIFQTTVDGCLINVNPSLALMSGFDSPQEMMENINNLGQQVYVYPEDRLRMSELLEKNGSVEGFEVQMYSEGNRIMWASMNARAVRDDKGNIAYFEGTVEDITKHKNAEQALRESEAKYRSVVESSLVGFYIIQDNIFRFVNRRFCEITGYDYDEVVDSMSSLDTIHPDDVMNVSERINKRLNREEDRVEYEIRIIRKNGQVIPVKIFGTRMDYNGRIAVSGTFLDIAHEKALESQLRQSQKVEAIGLLAGGVAHDFNNILTVLTGYGSILQLKMGKENPLCHYVDQMLSASQKASGLIQSLLAFSRQQPVILRPINLNVIVRGTEKLLKRLLTEDVALETHLAPEAVTVMADTTQVDQILFNLATNAGDAMKKGGTLTIGVSKVLLDIEFNLAHGFGEPGHYALLSVTDTGTGMDKKTQEKIFDPFFTTKGVGKGTGLGLSTVYGIVKQHSGYINVYSEPNVGTTFRIYIPIVKKAADDEEQPSQVNIKGGGETILVAEDNEDVRGFIKEVLSQYGYMVIEAVNGEDAIKKFVENDIVDLVVLDSIMPKKNGIEAYSEIIRKKPDVKTLFMSGYTEDIILDKGIYEKGFAFISKPLSPNDLLRKVREILDS